MPPRCPLDSGWGLRTSGWNRGPLLRLPGYWSSGGSRCPSGHHPPKENTRRTFNTFRTVCECKYLKLQLSTAKLFSMNCEISLFSREQDVLGLGVNKAHHLNKTERNTPSSGPKWHNRLLSSVKSLAHCLNYSTLKLHLYDITFQDTVIYTLT